MDKYYKKLIKSGGSFFARFLDGFFLMFSAAFLSFGFAVIRLRNLRAAGIISLCSFLIVFVLILKTNSVRFNRFKKKINDEIRQKLILERMVFGKEEPEIRGYINLGDKIFLSESGKRARLIAAYPKKILNPEDILEYINPKTDQIIATCDFDDDSALLCARKGIELKNKDFLLKNVVMNIDEDAIEEEIIKEVKYISEIKEKRKKSVFENSRRKKYLLAGLFLLFISLFMGIYRIIYVAFGGMCMSFFFISTIISKPQ